MHQRLGGRLAGTFRRAFGAPPGPGLAFAMRVWAAVVGLAAAAVGLLSAGPAPVVPAVAAPAVAALAVAAPAVAAPAAVRDFAAASAGCVTCHSHIGDPAFSREHHDAAIAGAQRHLRRLKEAEAAGATVTLRLTADEAAALESAGAPAPQRAEGLASVTLTREAGIAAFEALVAARTKARDSAAASVAADPASKAHPRLDVFVSEKSPHAAKLMGCVSCHRGDGAAKDFAAAGHSLMDAASPKAADWAKRHGWKPPAEAAAMLPVGRTEASCLQCHTQVTDLPRDLAPQVNHAHRLIRDAACFGCHQMVGFERDAAGKPGRAVRPDWEAEVPHTIGPSLEHVGRKMGVADIARWVLDPKAVRPTTRMPTVGHGRIDPAEATAIAAYLHRAGNIADLADPPAPDAAGFSRPGDASETFAQAGKRLFVESGCVACHGYAGLPSAAAPGERDFASDLTGLHFKLKGSPDARRWLYHWLRAPEKLSPKTRMPNLRLTDQESLAITTFLLNPADGDHKPAGDEGPKRPNAAPPKEDPFAAVKGVPDPLPAVRAETGREAIARHNCAACHDIPGFEPKRPAELALSTVGSPDGRKFPPALSTGKAPERSADYLSARLAKPAEFRRDDGTACPDYGFTPAQVEALTTYLLGLQKETVPETLPARYARPEQAAERALHAGAWVLERYNCAACHMLEPGRLTLRPDTLNGKRPDWLRLPAAVTLHGLPLSTLDDLPLPAETIARALDGDDMRELLTAVRWQLWRPTAADRVLQQWFASGLTDGEAAALAGTHPVFAPEAARKKLADLRSRHSFLELEPTSAAVVIPKADIVGYRPAEGGRLVEAIYGYLAHAEARDFKGLELAERVFGDEPKPAQIATLIPLALRDPQTRRPSVGEKYLFYKGPPPLTGEGAKVQGPWLAGFLKEPTTLRPLALGRMPKFAYRAGDIEAIVAYFAARDGVAADAPVPERRPRHLAERVGRLFAADGPLSEDVAFWSHDGAAKTFAQAGRERGWLHVAERTLFSEAAGNRCLNCHRWGDAPIAGTENLAPGAVPNVQAGPDLTKAAARLRPDYLRRWLAHPAMVLPGTPMPANWGDAPHARLDPVKARLLLPPAGKTLPDAERNRLQIEAVVDLLMNPSHTAMSAPGAKHSAVWPQIVEKLGLPPDKPAGK